MSQTAMRTEEWTTHRHYREGWLWVIDPNIPPPPHTAKGSEWVVQRIGGFPEATARRIVNAVNAKAV